MPSEYLAAALRSPQLRAQFDAVEFGVAVRRLNVAHVRDLRIPVAPAVEQQRIVAKLDALSARTRRAKDAIDAIPPLLERLRQSVLAAAFRGDLTADWRDKNPDVEPASELLKRIRAERRRRWEEAELAKMRAKRIVPGDDRWKAKYEEPGAVDGEELPNLPHGWGWASADEATDAARPICYGVVQPGDDPAVGVPLVRVCDLENETIAAGRLRRITHEIDEEYARSRLAGGEVLVSVVGTIGRTAVVSDDLAGANIARAVARLAPTAVPPAWLCLWLASPEMQTKLTLEAREVARKTLNIDTLRSAAVPLAPAAEMQLAASRAHAALGRIAKLADTVAAGDRRVAELDRSILARAFRGELVPQDPNDEPASVLLDRIRAEREAAAAAGNARAGKKPQPKPARRRSRTTEGEPA